MHLIIHFLEAEGSLASWRDTLCTETKDIGEQVSAMVPVEFRAQPVDILIQNFAEGAIPELSMGGSCFRRGLVTISLAPDSPNFGDVMAKGYFRQTLAHELHHSMRWGTCGYGETLGEAVISEGLADTFAARLTGMPQPPWTFALDKNQTLAVMARAKDELAQSYYDHAEWFFGTGELPRWTGYTLGYRLAQFYAAQHAAEAKRGLVDTPASTILESVWQHLERG
jgi:uncharacterized protein YjaZ